MLRFAHEEVPAMNSCSCFCSILGHVGDGDTWLDSLSRKSQAKSPTPISTALDGEAPVNPPLARHRLG